jgi:hypothetical protein
MPDVRRIKKSIETSMDTIIDVTNISDSSDHEAIIDMEPFEQVAIQLEFKTGMGIDTITVDVHGTVQSDVALTARTYGDITVGLYDLISAGSAANYTANAILVCAYKIPLTGLRVHYKRTAGAANNADLKVSTKRY